MKLCAAALDALARWKWGCSHDDYVTLKGKPLRAFHEHRRNARDRGIGWEFNLWQWWTVWQESGRWAERGRGSACYVMCRIGDAGPYAIDNVYVATSAQNIRDGFANRRSSTFVGINRGGPS